MACWLMKSEPDVYSWSDLVRDKRSAWDGVRNYQANNNMKAMKKGDEAFFYHSNEDRAAVGIMKVVGEWRPDPADKTGRFGMVEVAPVRALERPLPLVEIKEDPLLKKMAFVRQGRLSVSPVTAEEWRTLLKLAQSR